MSEFAYDGQLAAIPSAVRHMLSGTELPRLDAARPIIFCGIGTSLHAARVATGWITSLTKGQVRPFAIDAHDLGTGVAPVVAGDQVVVISHRGKKLFPTASLQRAREAGAAMTIAIVGQGAPAQQADVTIRTCPNETAGTFSVSYLASLAILARLAAPFEQEGHAFADALPGLPDLLERTLLLPLDTQMIAQLSDVQTLLITGFGNDLPTAQEAALKIKEGAWMWTEAMSPEFALHGTPASFHSGMGAIVIVPDHDDGGRSAVLRGVLSSLGLACVLTCDGTSTNANLPFVAPMHPLLRAFHAILPFHRLTAELARYRGTDPDTLHGHREPWKTVMTGLRL